MSVATAFGQWLGALSSYFTSWGAEEARLFPGESFGHLFGLAWWLGGLIFRPHLKSMSHHYHVWPLREIHTHMHTHIYIYILHI